MSFWQSGSGTAITGDAKNAFLQDFSLIPDSTLALAKIESIGLVKKTDQYGEKKYYEIIWKITSDDFKGRIVSQKIKPFDGKPEAIDRNLNMFKLIMDLCKFKPTHSNAPVSSELTPMIGKVAGIKIREWSMPKQDGSGIMEGNFVSEVHPSSGFECALGTKLEVVHPATNHLESAFSRNQKPIGVVDTLDEDLPF